VLHGSYMSAESMAPLAARFAATRPVIAISQRGHGRTGDVAGGITYELLADDAAGRWNASTSGCRRLPMRLRPWSRN
jgi:pimeloyl-ACP methyl ester carboxylesterase